MHLTRPRSQASSVPAARQSRLNHHRLPPPTPLAKLSPTLPTLASSQSPTIFRGGASLLHLHRPLHLLRVGGGGGPWNQEEEAMLRVGDEGLQRRCAAISICLQTRLPIHVALFSFAP